MSWTIKQFIQIVSEQEFTTSTSTQSISQWLKAAKDHLSSSEYYELLQSAVKYLRDNESESIRIRTPKWYGYYVSFVKPYQDLIDWINLEASNLSIDISEESPALPSWLQLITIASAILIVFSKLPGADAKLNTAENADDNNDPEIPETVMNGQAGIQDIFTIKPTIFPAQAHRITINGWESKWDAQLGEQAVADKLDLSAFSNEFLIASFAPNGNDTQLSLDTLGAANPRKYADITFKNVSPLNFCLWPNPWHRDTLYIALNSTPGITQCFFNLPLAYFPNTPFVNLRAYAATTFKAYQYIDYTPSICPDLSPGYTVLTTSRPGVYLSIEGKVTTIDNSFSAAYQNNPVPVIYVTPQSTKIELSLPSYNTKLTTPPAHIFFDFPTPLVLQATSYSSGILSIETGYKIIEFTGENVLWLCSDNPILAMVKDNSGLLPALIDCTRLYFTSLFSTVPDFSKMMPQSSSCITRDLFPKGNPRFILACDNDTIKLEHGVFHIRQAKHVVLETGKNSYSATISGFVTEGLERTIIDYPPGTEIRVKNKNYDTFIHFPAFGQTLTLLNTAPQAFCYHLNAFRKNLSTIDPEDTRFLDGSVDCSLVTGTDLKLVGPYTDLVCSFPVLEKHTSYQPRFKFTSNAHFIARTERYGAAGGQREHTTLFSMNEESPLSPPLEDVTLAYEILRQDKVKVIVAKVHYSYCSIFKNFARSDHQLRVPMDAVSHSIVNGFYPDIEFELMGNINITPPVKWLTVNPDQKSLRLAPTWRDVSWNEQCVMIYAQNNHSYFTWNQCFIINVDTIKVVKMVATDTSFHVVLAALATIIGINHLLKKSQHNNFLRQMESSFNSANIPAVHRHRLSTHLLNKHSVFSSYIYCLSSRRLHQAQREAREIIQSFNLHDEIERLLLSNELNLLVGKAPNAHRKLIQKVVISALNDFKNIYSSSMSICAHLLHNKFSQRQKLTEVLNDFINNTLFAEADQTILGAALQAELYYKLQITFILDLPSYATIRTEIDLSCQCDVLLEEVKSVEELQQLRATIRAGIVNLPDTLSENAEVRNAVNELINMRSHRYYTNFQDVLDINYQVYKQLFDLCLREYESRYEYKGRYENLPALRN